MIRIVGNRDAPTDGCAQATHGKILQTAGDETFDFVAARLRPHKISTLVEIQQRLVVVRESKEIALFRNSIEFRFVNQTRWWFAFAGGLRVFVFSLVGCARRAEPTFVVSFVKRVVALRRLGFRHASPKLAGTFIVKRTRRAHEDVIAAMRGIEAELCRHLREIADYVIGLFLRGAIVPLRGALDIDAVFVSTRQEKCFNSLLAF